MSKNDLLLSLSTLLIFGITMGMGAVAGTGLPRNL